MFRIVRRYTTKIVRTPSMGESITEGTLTEWHKKIGDVIKHDELVATIETDKIDVSVNSSDSGTLKKLYAEVGETILVGGNLFEIDTNVATADSGVDDGKSKPVETISANTAADDVKIRTTFTSSPNLNSEYARVPSIKFLGSRRNELVIPAKYAQKPQASINNVKTGKYIYYESMDLLPKKYQPIELSKLEMETIDVCKNLYRMAVPIAEHRNICITTIWHCMKLHQQP